MSLFSFWIFLLENNFGEKEKNGVLVFQGWIFGFVEKVEKGSWENIKWHDIEKFYTQVQFNSIFCKKDEISK